MERAPIFAAVGKLIPGIWSVPGAIPLMDRLIDMAPAGTAAPSDKLPFPISAIDVDLLALVSPHVKREDLAPWVEPLRKACLRFEINTIRRVAAFIANLAHESGFVVKARENMNYSAHRMAEVWPTRFRGAWNAPTALARAIEHKPEEIANHVYANRMGNGPPESGDGWRFRGNGPLQLTGRANHAAFAAAMGVGIDEAVVWIGTIEGGVMSAAWFWEENDINRLADTPGVEDEVRKINGGKVGLSHRKALFDALVARLLLIEKGARA